MAAIANAIRHEEQRETIRLAYSAAQNYHSVLGGTSGRGPRGSAMGPTTENIRDLLGLFGALQTPTRELLLQSLQELLVSATLGKPESEETIYLTVEQTAVVTDKEHRKALEGLAQLKTVVADTSQDLVASAE